MERRRLPDRRPCWVETLFHTEPDGSVVKLHVTYGLDAADLAAGKAEVRETFIRPRAKAGSERERLYDEMAIFNSRLIQMGVPIAELRRSASRGTVIGTVLDAAVVLERDLGAALEMKP